MLVFALLLYTLLVAYVESQGAEVFGTGRNVMKISIRKFVDRRMKTALRGVWEREWRIKLSTRTGLRINQNKKAPGIMLRQGFTLSNLIPYCLITRK